MSNSASSQEDFILSEQEGDLWDELRKNIKSVTVAPPQNLTHKPKTLIQIIRPKLGDSIMLFAPEQELKVFFDGQNIKIEVSVENRWWKGIRYNGNLHHFNVRLETCNFSLTHITTLSTGK